MSQFGFVNVSFIWSNLQKNKSVRLEVRVSVCYVVYFCRFTVSVEGLEEPVLLPEVVFKSLNGLHVKLTPRD